MTLYKGFNIDESDCKCLECNKSFSSVANLHRHTVTHRKHPVKCDICGKEFSNNKARAGHMSKHNGHKNDLALSCKCCNRIFHGRRALANHLRMQRYVTYDSHNKDDCELLSNVPYCCHVCGKVFASPISLSNHSRRHDAEFASKMDANVSKAQKARFANPECRKRMSELHKRPDVRKRHRDAQLRAWANASPEHRQKRVEICTNNCMSSRTSTIQGRRSVVKSAKAPSPIKCDSGWEAWFCSIADADGNVIAYRKVHEGIPYIWNGRQHKYYPDFIVTYADGHKEVIEVKSDSTAYSEYVQTKAKAAIEHYAKLGIPYRMMLFADLRQYESEVMPSETDCED